jgi:hypothetical protein
MNKIKYYTKILKSNDHYFLNFFITYIFYLIFFIDLFLHLKITNIFTLTTIII